MRIVMILTQVNLFYAVTQDWEITLSYLSLIKTELFWAIENYVDTISKKYNIFVN